MNVDRDLRVVVPVAEWDVNEVVDQLWSLAPRRRWMTLNSEFFGPHFSVSSLISATLADLERLLEPHKWAQNSCTLLRKTSGYDPAEVVVRPHP